MTMLKGCRVAASKVRPGQVSPSTYTHSIGRPFTVEDTDLGLDLIEVVHLDPIRAAKPLHRFFVVVIYVIYRTVIRMVL